MAIPAPLIAPLRTALMSQGFPANTVGDDGAINPAGLLGGVVESVEVRTTMSPPVSIKLGEIQLGGPPNPFAQFLKPTFVLKTRMGVSTLAPYGEAGDGTLGAVAVVAGLVGLGFLLGRLL